MELTEEHIKRIDSFLERLGCEYIDIRFEMVDHIATDIERNIVDLEIFFKKDKMRGEFLLYMMRKKEVFEDTYYKQSKKQFWNNLVYITKSAFKEMFTIKHVILVALLIMFVRFGIQYNIKYTLFFTTIFSIINFGYSSYILNKIVKKYGKIRFVHSFISLSTIPFIMIVQFYNIFKILKSTNHDMAITFIYSMLLFIVFNTLLILVFTNNTKQFKNKHKYLID